MNLDIIAQLVKILKESPELGAIEVPPGFVRGLVVGASEQGWAFEAMRQASTWSGFGARPPPRGGWRRPRSAAPPSHLVEISHMVGTFYSAPEPGAEPYVKAGRRVGRGQVVCISKR